MQMRTAHLKLRVSEGRRGATDKDPATPRCLRVNRADYLQIYRISAQHHLTEKLEHVGEYFKNN